MEIFRCERHADLFDFWRDFLRVNLRGRLRANFWGDGFQWDFDRWMLGGDFRNFDGRLFGRGGLWGSLWFHLARLAANQKPTQLTLIRSLPILTSLDLSNHVIAGIRDTHFACLINGYSVRRPKPSISPCAVRRSNVSSAPCKS